jgi:monovalent cation:H+ antiporter-2, CPA2 family
VITEKRPDIVSDARSEGRPVFYGDALNTSFLIHCGLLRARAVIITIHDWSATEDIVRMIRALSPTITIIARARDADHARFLYEIGVTDAVPETIEASLQLSEAALVDLGVPTGPVIASIHEKRDEFRSALQSAAGKAGRKDSHGVRAKTTPPIES